MKEERVRDAIIRGILAWMSAMMLVMDMEVPMETSYMTGLSELLMNLSYCFRDKAVIMTLLFVSIYAFGKKEYCPKLTRRSVFLVLSAFIGIIWLMGANYDIDNSLIHIYMSLGQIVKSIIYVIGASYLVYILIIGYINLLWGNKKEGSVFRINGVKLSIVLLVCWLIPTIVSYPGYMCSDAWSQLAQYWGYSSFSTHHPPFHTIIIGVFSRIGLTFGSADIGIFMYIVFQSIVFALVISYAFLLLKRINAPAWLEVFFFTMAIFSPYICNRITVVLKDSLYSIMFLLFIVEITWAILFFDEYIHSIKHGVLTIISIMCVCLLRNNGIYVVIPSILCLSVWIALNNRKRFREIVKFILLNIVSVCGVSIITVILMFTVVEKRGSIMEMLSFPLQQTARTVVEHYDQITDAEREAIDGVIIYENIVDKYNPRICDPIKSNRRGEPTKEALLAYLKTWFKMGFKYPMSYVSATVNQNYILIYPFSENNVVYALHDCPDNPRISAMMDELNMRKDVPMNEVEYYGMTLMFSLPVIGIISHTSIYVIAFVVVFILSIIDKKYSITILGIPIMLSLGIVMLSPVIDGHPRYAFPIIYSMPILAGAYMWTKGSILLKESKCLKEGGV